MITSKRVGLVAVAWCLAFIAFAALLRALTPPHASVPGVLPTTAPRVHALDPPTNVVVVEPIVIVAERPRPMTPPTSARSAPSGRELRCGEWRELLQGGAGQRVRLCE
jgi:hypothetical protein